MKKLKNIYIFIRKILVKRNLLQFKNIHSFYLQGQQSQLNDINFLLQKYPESIDKNKLSSEEYQVYSQNGEDGVLLNLIKCAKIKQKKCLEIGAGGQSSNILNLNLNFGFDGVYIDGDKNELEIQKSNLSNFIHSFKNTGSSTYMEKMINPDNIEELDAELVFRDFAVCSLDIDGIDFYIFDKILDFNFPIVVAEYNSLFSVKNKYSVPFSEKFSRYDYHPSQLIFGCSLDALNFVAEKKGYSLVYCESNGVNSFFVNNNYLPNSFVKLSPKEAFKENYKLKNQSKEFDLKNVLELLIKVDTL